MSIETDNDTRLCRRLPARRSSARSRRTSRADDDGPADARLLSRTLAGVLLPPADFTPVCTSEFVAFAHAYEAFRDIDCDLLALSVDSLSSHLAWKHSIEQRFGVRCHSLSSKIPPWASPGLRHAAGWLDVERHRPTNVRHRS